MNFNQAFDPFRSLRASWAALFRSPVSLFIGGVILTFLAGGGPSGGFNLPTERDLREHGVTPEMVAAMFGVVFFAFCCLGMVLLLFSSWVAVGFYRAVERTLQQGTSDIGELFELTSQFWPMFGVRLLSGVLQLVAALPVAVVAGVLIFFAAARQGTPAAALAIVAAIVAALAYLPVGIYVALGLVFVRQAVALERLGVIDAIRRSWSVAAGRRLALFWFALVMVVTSFAGFCACCVGVLVTGPLVQVAWAEAYLLFTRGESTAGWWINTRAATVKPVESWGSMPPPLVPPLPQIPPPPPPA